MRPFVRSPYNYDSDAASSEAALDCSGSVDRARQEFKEESDINTIVKRFGITGKLPENVRMPQYGDFTGVTDYQSALNAMKEAEKSFMAMPAEVRKRFDNDPHKFVEFCTDDSNRAEAEKLGLVDARKLQAALSPSPATPTPSSPSAPSPAVLAAPTKP